MGAAIQDPTIEKLCSMGIETVRDLANYAHARGIKPSELLARLSAEGGESLPPAGFIRVPLDELEIDTWKGPSICGDGWEVQTAWAPDFGVTLALVQPTTELDPAQALAAGTALAETAAKYA